jgi:hypothetical protein
MAKKKLKFKETDAFPSCPSCKKEMREILTATKGFFFSTSIMMCPHCKAFLGVAKENLC